MTQNRVAVVTGAAEDLGSAIASNAYINGADPMLAA